MSDLAVIVEGQTEKTFVETLLAAHLGSRGITTWARLPGQVAPQGGVRAWPSVRAVITRTLRERRGRVCTTMFDFCGMPHEWPGRAEAVPMPSNRRGDHVEQAMIDDLAAHAGEAFQKELFIPYVQVHEFEALLFSDVDKMAEVLAQVSPEDRGRLAARFKDILDEAGPPEAINDGWETCPSRRISGIVPRYKKPTFGPLVGGRIGLDVLRVQCPHFGQWLTRLESLGGGAEAWSSLAPRQP